MDIQNKLKSLDKEEQAKVVQIKGEQSLIILPSLNKNTLNRAEGRELIIKSFRNFAAQNALSKTKSVKIFCDQYNNKKILNDTLIHHLMPAISQRSLYNWEKEYAQSGISGLADNYGTRKGQTIIDTNTPIKEFILGMIAAHPHANCKHIVWCQRVGINGARSIIIIHP